MNQPYVLSQIAVLLSTNRTWSATLKVENLLITSLVRELFSKPYRGHLRCASQDLSSDNSCSHSHRTCISSAGVYELKLISGWGESCENLNHFATNMVFFKILAKRIFYLTMLLVYVVLQVGEFSVERNVRDQMMANVFGQIWLILNLEANPL